MTATHSSCETIGILIASSWGGYHATSGRAEHDIARKVYFKGKQLAASQLA